MRHTVSTLHTNWLHIIYHLVAQLVVADLIHTLGLDIGSLPIHLLSSKMTDPLGVLKQYPLLHWVGLVQGTLILHVIAHSLRVKRV